MPYDVGAIARRIQDEFRLFRRSSRVDVGTGENLATPQHEKVLLDSLSRMTDALLEQRDGLSDLVPDAGLIVWDHNMMRWRERLGLYLDAVNAAAPGDRQAILWTVTAPLLLGFYGGKDSKLPQQTMDAVTPFALANQLEVTEEWRTERLNLLWEDIKSNAAAAAGGVGGIIATVVAIVLGVTFLRRRRN